MIKHEDTYDYRFRSCLTVETCEQVMEYVDGVIAMMKNVRIKHGHFEANFDIQGSVWVRLELTNHEGDGSNIYGQVFIFDHEIMNGQHSEPEMRLGDFAVDIATHYLKLLREREEKKDEQPG
jgi:hypothetical protein